MFWDPFHILKVILFSYLCTGLLSICLPALFLANFVELYRKSFNLRSLKYMLTHHSGNLLHFTALENNKLSKVRWPATPKIINIPAVASADRHPPPAAPVFSEEEIGIGRGGKGKGNIAPRFSDTGFGQEETLEEGSVAPLSAEVTRVVLANDGENVASSSLVEKKAETEKIAGAPVTSSESKDGMDIDMGVEGTSGTSALPEAQGEPMEDIREETLLKGNAPPPLLPPSCVDGSGSAKIQGEPGMGSEDAKGPVISTTNEDGSEEEHLESAGLVIIDNTHRIIIGSYTVGTAPGKAISLMENFVKAL